MGDTNRSIVVAFSALAVLAVGVSTLAAGPVGADTGAQYDQEPASAVLGGEEIGPNNSSGNGTFHLMDSEENNQLTDQEVQSAGKAKPGDTSDGGNGKSKMDGDGDDATTDGGNGKAKHGGGASTTETTTDTTTDSADTTTDSTDTTIVRTTDTTTDTTETTTDTTTQKTDSTEPTDTTTETTTDAGSGTDNPTTTVTTTGAVDAVTNGVSIGGVVLVIGVLSVALLFRREN